MLNKLTTCEIVRAWTAKSLFSSIKTVITFKKSITEILLRDQWLLELRKNPDIFSDGWYTPPPHGVAVLIGTANKVSRTNYISLRSKSLWPQSKYALNSTNSLMYVYASPVNRELGIIGDFGMSIYFGKNKRIKDHLKRCLAINKIVFEYIKIGMSFSEIYHFTINQAKKSGMVNNIVSKTDPAGVDVGHTIPASYENWSEEELHILKKREWKTIKDMISKKRKFVSPKETLTCQPDMAMTLEPRLVSSDDPEMPLTSFHTIVTFDKSGKKRLLTNFDDIFGLVGMNYMMD